MGSSVPVLCLAWLSAPVVSWAQILPSGGHLRNIVEIFSVLLLLQNIFSLQPLPWGAIVIIVFYGHIFHLFLSYSDRPHAHRPAKSGFPPPAPAAVYLEKDT